MVCAALARIQDRVRSFTYTKSTLTCEIGSPDLAGLGDCTGNHKTMYRMPQNDAIHYQSNYKVDAQAVESCEAQNGHLADLSDPSIWNEAVTAVSAILCLGGSFSCCNSNPNYCAIGDGDCDTNTHCNFGTTCGTDNCYIPGTSYVGSSDCCQDPDNGELTFNK